MSRLALIAAPVVLSAAALVPLVSTTPPPTSTTDGTPTTSIDITPAAPTTAPTSRSAHSRPSGSPSSVHPGTVPSAIGTGTGGPSRTGYRPPVDDPVVEGFRAPDGPYGAGHRGVDYRTTPGEPVRAVGDGVVVFVGVIAGQRYVTVLHPDGLRSTASYLASTTVQVGDRVRRGDPIGTAASLLHLGVRRGDTYLDPLTLFDAGRRRAVLVAPGAGSVAPSTTSPRSSTSSTVTAN